MRLFGIILRIVELILLISISVLIVCVLWTCEDKATLTDCLSVSAVGLFWLFPITIPIAVCLLVSLFVSLISQSKQRTFIINSSLESICSTSLSYHLRSYFYLLPANHLPLKKWLTITTNMLKI